MKNFEEDGKNSYRQRLRKYLNEHLTIAELINFCFDTGISDADFNQNNLSVFVVELLKMLFAKGQVQTLIHWLKAEGYFPPTS